MLAEAPFLRPVLSLALRGWFRILRYTPMPSEAKWRSGVTLLSEVVMSGIAVDHQAWRPAASLQEILDQAGQRWMESRAGSDRGITPATAEIIAGHASLALKALDMPSIVGVHGTTVKVVTYGCPFLQRVTPGKAGRMACWAICSDDRSLFHGIAKGLPNAEDYRSPQKMGWGDPVCVKEFDAKVDVAVEERLSI